MARAIFLTLLALATCSCDTTGPTASPRSHEPAPLAGVHWQLCAVEGPAGAATFPGTVDGWLEATDSGTVTGSDGCVFFSATSRTTSDRLRLMEPIETANGCVHQSAPLVAMRTAVDRALLSRHRTHLMLTAERLIIRGSGYVLRYAERAEGRR
jgi:hypothetical protein